MDLITADIGVRDDIISATVRLLNTGGLTAVTLPAIAAKAGIAPDRLAAEFGTVGDIYQELASSLSAAISTAVASTLIRRRSLTETLQVGLAAAWSVVEDRIDERQAMQYLGVAELTCPGLIGGTHSSQHAAQCANTERLLTDIERIHGISWELPVRLLAQLTLATLDGLVLGYLSDRDSGAARRVLDVFAFQLAQHGRRAAKNNPY